MANFRRCDFYLRGSVLSLADYRLADKPRFKKGLRDSAAYDAWINVFLRVGGLA